MQRPLSPLKCPLHITGDRLAYVPDLRCIYMHVVLYRSGIYRAKLFTLFFKLLFLFSDKSYASSHVNIKVIIS